MDLEERRDWLCSLIASLPAKIRTASGAALYSGLASLKQGKIYIVGFNPGGIPESSDHVNRTVEGSVDRVPLHGSDYTDECWDGPNGKWKYPKGEAPHQQRVRAICNAAQVDPKDAFAANAIFVRTRKSEGLRQLDRLWVEHFWPIHQEFFSVVLPKMVIALGNGEERSSYRLMLSVSRETAILPLEAGVNAKFARISIPLRSGRTHDSLLVGVRHPSRFPVSEELCAKIHREAQTAT